MKTAVCTSLLVLLNAVLANVTIGAQTRPHMVCVGNFNWLVVGTKAVRLSSCEKPGWAAYIVLGSADSTNVRKTDDERDLIKALSATPEEGFKPVPISGPGLPDLASPRIIDRKIRLDPNRVPKFVQAFLAQPATIIVTRGNLFADNGEYRETSRFSVDVRDLNETVAEFLKSVREAHPDRLFVARYGRYFFLQNPVTGVFLKESSTLLDAEIEDGSILRLFVSIR